MDLCDKQVAYYQMDGYRGSVKCPYRVPHDLGNPGKHFDEISKVAFILIKIFPHLKMCKSRLHMLSFAFFPCIQIIAYQFAI